MFIIYDKKNSNKVLFVNYEGKLKILYTPFQVLCICDTGFIKASTIVYVEAVACTQQNELLYIIYGIAHHYHFFYLVARF